MRSSKYSGSQIDILEIQVPRLTLSSRLLGTPNEQQWPGVTSFPDFKSSFPNWNRDMSRALVNGLGDDGLDLLDAMLVYDPANRLSAKQACLHPYFELGSSAYSGRGRGTNGYH